MRLARKRAAHIQRALGDIMTFRFGALLCLAWLAACNRENTQEPRDPAYVSQRSETDAETEDRAMKPASLEDSQRKDRESSRATGPAAAAAPAPAPAAAAESPP